MRAHHAGIRVWKADQRPPTCAEGAGWRCTHDPSHLRGPDPSAAPMAPRTCGGSIPRPTPWPLARAGGRSLSRTHGPTHVRAIDPSAAPMAPHTCGGSTPQPHPWPHTRAGDRPLSRTHGPTHVRTVDPPVDPMAPHRCGGSIHRLIPRIHARPRGSRSAFLAEIVTPRGTSQRAAGQVRAASTGSRAESRPRSPLPRRCAQ